MILPLSSEQAKINGAKGAAVREAKKAKLKELSFHERELLRVRARIDEFHDDLESATEAIDKERLARGLCSLGTYEGKLAGRPDPGSYRPTAPTKQIHKPIEPQEA